MHKNRVYVFGVLFMLILASRFGAQSVSVDPGPRQGQFVGGPLDGLTSGQLESFKTGGDDFNSAHSVDGSFPDADATGLGPGFNLDNCGGCHVFPAIGGTSPRINPQIEMASKAGARNKIPFFITLQGPIIETRFISNPDGSPDGHVHPVFTIAGRTDAPGCDISQPNFDAEVAKRNVIARIPTPVFGGGLVENITDAAILENKNANAAVKYWLGIRGHENRTVDEGIITRFGWKAQNRSLMVFSGEAYNIEMGVTNELSPTELNQSPNCQFQPTPEDHPDFDTGEVSAVVNFTNFMRFLAPPVPAPDTSSIVRGRGFFARIGCVLCHTPTFTTRSSDIDALSNKPVNLFSDLLVHNMGVGLADHISQGQASGDEFRSAPLWGLGQRIFFLHDGRTTDLKAAILAHRSTGSESSLVIDAFDALTSQQQQDLLNFLRSL